ncbi:hypothetical protein PNOK_0794800 [Pyrrhoderma noxium]|uniref:Uncharacterized protein n=1 Tax=Pyrrhoderma noxium TaxID=2282107 RepID=A0A286U9S6_9AGAM|nr:hypothetical protein PNOK_0794800 [Pyrrhoderma noxium]
MNIHLVIHQTKTFHHYVNETIIVLIECAAPKNWNSSTSSLNFNGSVCLKSVCMYANATLGLPCILEQTMYKGYNRDQSIFNLTIFRDNCVTSRPQLYCSSSTSVCEKMKDYHELCTNDRECLSHYCGISGLCADPPGLPVTVEPWQYALTVLSVILAIMTICIFLTLNHKRQRLDQRYELLEYYHEQKSLRASIISLHTTASQRLNKEKLHIH